jgi:hypothetical protein
MSIDNQSKLQKVLQSWLAGTVNTSAWLAGLGVSAQLLKKYVDNGWLQAIANGAYIKAGDKVGWQGGLYAMHTQSGLSIHGGALTALSLQGYAHYLRLGKDTVHLFSPQKVSLPAWFKHHDWEQSIYHCKTCILPSDLALVDFQVGDFSIKISTPERAILECLHLSPDMCDLVECYQLMEGLTTLRPKVLQVLLEQCNSIKVKRLFLYMATKANHDWLKRLDAAKFDLGTGSRTIVKGGVYVAQFSLIIPEELVKL